MCVCVCLRFFCSDRENPPAEAGRRFAWLFFLVAKAQLVGGTADLVASTTVLMCTLSFLRCTVPESWLKDTTTGMLQKEREGKRERERTYVFEDVCDEECGRYILCDLGQYS